MQLIGTYFFIKVMISMLKDCTIEDLSKYNIDSSDCRVSKPHMRVLGEVTSLFIK